MHLWDLSSSFLYHFMDHYNAMMKLKILRADLMDSVGSDFLLTLCANSFLKTTYRSENLEKQSNKLRTMAA